jgi:hypothetical protein
MDYNLEVNTLLSPQTHGIKTGPEKTNHYLKLHQRNADGPVLTMTSVPWNFEANLGKASQELSHSPSGFIHHSPSEIIPYWPRQCFNLGRKGAMIQVLTSWSQWDGWFRLTRQLPLLIDFGKITGTDGTVLLDREEGIQNYLIHEKECCLYAGCRCEILGN